MKKIFFAFLFVLGLCSVVSADNVTLTTYYPAPFGMYQEMRVMGKLGVGTTDPQSPLHVVGDVATDYGVTLKQYHAGWGSNTTRPYLAKGWNVSGYDFLYLGSTGNQSNINQGALLLVGGGEMRFGKGANDPFNSNPISTEWMRIDNAGKVGIGTTLPFAPLHVKSSSNYASIFEQTPNVASSFAVMAFQGKPPVSPAAKGGIYIDSASDAYGVYQTSGGTNYFSGNVGIKIASPSTPLQVDGAGAVWKSTALFHLSQNTAGNYGVLIYQGNSPTSPPTTKGGIYIDSASDAYGVYQTNGGANYFFGKVGIKNTNPSAELDVTGDINASGQLQENGVRVVTTDKVTYSTKMYKNICGCDGLSNKLVTTTASCATGAFSCHGGSHYGCGELAQTTCEETEGCYWHGHPPGYCSGFYDCNAQSNEPLCNSLPDCSWGQSTSCSNQLLGSGVLP